MLEKKESYHVIGVMSGTSLDGLDILACRLYKKKDEWFYEIIDAKTNFYSDKWRKKLRKAHQNSPKKLEKLDEKFGEYTAKKIEKFISKTSFKPDMICSHGHTVFHQPQKGITKQIGSGRIISELTSLPVVHDFRTQDVKLGGQGAPLVPFGDKLLFSTYQYCLNLGGFANISFEEKGERVAYDVCPVNIILNKLSKVMGVPYDDEGKIAEGGSLNQTFFDQLNSLSYYKATYPKSLGREWTRDEIKPLIKQKKLMLTKDIMHTFCEHMAYQIARSIRKKGKILVTGGGAYNKFLIDRINNYLPKKAELVVPDKKTVEFKEALIFALLGVLKVRGEINTLKSVTGASKDHSAGKIAFPK